MTTPTRAAVEALAAKLERQSEEASLPIGEAWASLDKAAAALRSLLARVEELERAKNTADTSPADHEGKARE